MVMIIHVMSNTCFSVYLRAREIYYGNKENLMARVNVV